MRRKSARKWHACARSDSQNTSSMRAHGLQTPFLSDSWFDAVTVAIREAAQTDMRVWIADDFNTPSGTAGGRITSNTDYREHYFTPDWHFQPDRDPQHGPTSVDYLNPACTRAFIALCYQPYVDRFAPFLGDVIPGFVNHEPRFANPYPWSSALAERGARTAMFITAASANSSCAIYLRPLREWCNRYGVLFTGPWAGCGNAGQPDALPVGDAWEVLGSYHNPGVDHLGMAAQGHHPRLAASIDPTWPARAS